MLSTALLKGLERVISAVPSASIPAFLLPAFPAISTRAFSSSTARPSQIGRAPLSIPPEVTFTILPPPERKNGATVNIEGPLGRMSLTTPRFVNIEHDAATRKAFVTVEDREVKKQREMWGTTRAYLQNHILGVSEGHTAILRLVGVGYRATIENTATTVQPEFEGQQFVSLKVGYSHPIEMPIPKGVKASTPQPTRILLEGCEKEVVLLFAAKIRMWRKPEPYKGKGIFVNGETIKLKAKKIK
ncbi:probable MRPL6-mitochondrial ribosomal protein, large subunit [Rhynchosporium agropyri]|uniref:Large ribosomal subunit protein uL6m n=1 Tax=Rhynchosporium agropyri TaxID=914238 RepID=A0A1E1K492_9HELO|nr:probable MRPL6-mitochondrial ribosomal protein, large subunit [Rhynchosporium agropyri]